MMLSPGDSVALRQLLLLLLPEEEAVAIWRRHRTDPPTDWLAVGQEMGTHPLRVSRLYRKGLKRLRQPGRLLWGLLLEVPATDR